MISVQLHGGAQLAQALASLSPAKSRGLMTAMLKQAAVPIQQRMRELAPVEPGPPDLRDHIAIATASGVLEGPDEVRAKQAGEAAVAIGPEPAFFYGLFQEYGTVRHAAQPFMRPALDQRASAAIKLLQDVIWRHLRARSGSGRTT